MFGIIQIALVIVLIAAVIFYFGKIRHAKKSLIAGLVLCVAIAAVISNAVLSIIPLPTEKVVVTATGEKNENAGSNEVFISSLIIGGEEYELPKPSEGEWFWFQNKWYIWRNENDTRRPAGLTRSITFDIPYGQDRSILFARSQWMGIVEVSYGDQTKSYDLFSNGDEEQALPYAPIPDTEFFPLYGIKLLREVLFLLFIAILTAYPVYASLKFDYETIKKFWKKHWDKLAYIAIAFCCFCFMFEFGKQGSLWFDELWKVGVFLKNNFSFNIMDYITDIWVDIMPYGQEYLLALPQLLVAFSIYVLGLIGNKLKGKHLGVISAALGATSSAFLISCGTEFSNYAFILFFSVVTIYMFVKKQNELGKEKIITLLLYGVCLTLLMHSHLFGLVTAGIIMVFDFILIVMRKAKVKGLIEFALPAVYGVYWLCKFFFPSLAVYTSGGNSWASKPTLKSVVTFIISLCGGNWQFILFVLGSVFIVCRLIAKITRYKFDFKQDYTMLVLLCTPVLVFFVNIVVSGSSSTSSSLFVSRYFTPIFSFFILIIGIAIDMIIDVVAEGKDVASTNFNAVSLTVAFAFAISQCAICWLDQQVYSPENYKDTAEYLMTQNDIYSDSTVVIVYGANFVNDGFEYYLTQNGRRQSINHQENEADFSEFDIIYVCYQHYDRLYNQFDEAYADEGYVKVSENTSVKIIKYAKKS
ncbi:MAG: hypothetical protein NC394_03305 [Bacteroides sp.]|nr:hypothetical protein [Bacteroides sp.]